MNYTTFLYLPYMLRVLNNRMRLLKEGRLIYYDKEVITPVSSRRLKIKTNSSLTNYIKNNKQLRKYC